MIKQEFMDSVRWNKDGLVSVIVIDDETKAVLMQAYTDKAGLLDSIATKQATYWSRSRQEKWIKGATSGHTQAIQEIFIDCDGDAIIFSVIQTGNACHTGAQTCFYRRLDFSGD